MKEMIIQSICSMVCVGSYFLSYIDKQNQLTYLRMQIPQVEQEIIELKEEIAELKYDIDQFESPSNLLDIAQLPEFSHLQYPFMQDILSLQEGLAMHTDHSDRLQR